MGEEYDKLESSSNIAQINYSLELEDLAHGVILLLSLGYILATLLFFHELISFHSNKSDKNIENDKNDNSMKVMKIDGQYIPNIAECNNLNEKRLHKKLLQNYEIYFIDKKLL